MLSLHVSSLYAQGTELARKKCATFGFTENTAPHNECVRQFLQSSGAVNRDNKKALKPATVNLPTQREDKFWDDAMLTGNKEAFNAYLGSYPKGRYAALAQANILRLDNIKKGVQPLGAEVLKKDQLVAESAAAKKQELDAARLAATKLLPGQTIKDCADCPEMVVLPSGSFGMGSYDYLDEQPIHSVSISNYLIGKAEVTQGQWRAVMGNNPSRFSQCGDYCPVEQVSWNDAQEFARRLSQKTGKQYRLPSEAEWEYAARAGTDTKWSFGDSPYVLVDYAWYGANSQGRTQLVAQKKQNQFGLFDMYGNVMEWVEDCDHQNYIGAPTNGEAWITDCLSGRRMVRGGSAFQSLMFNLRPSNRYFFLSERRFNDVGFRLARAL